MEALQHAIAQMIRVSPGELADFTRQTIKRKFKRLDIVSRVDTVPNEIFFVVKGVIRVIVTDREGVDHTVHFALENQFIADYSCFLTQQPSMYTLQALEETETMVLPRSAVDWGYQHMQEGQKLGRLIAEFYFMYQDNRIKNLYARTPKERYNTITDVFPNIHNRVPQHMIASYLGITPVHLSRLKKVGV